MIKKLGKMLICFGVILAVSCLIVPSAVCAASVNCTEQKTFVNKQIQAAGSYYNWDGVTNVSQFLNEKGELCFAYDNNKYVKVIKTKKGVPSGKPINLKKKTTIFGAVSCDKEGNFYVVTGKNNKNSDKKVNTIFVTKYDKTGNLIKFIGDKGSSSLAYYYDDSFYTREPFSAGNCDLSINGDYLAVNYAREMYNGHQSNSLFLINKEEMKLIKINGYYNSHSFAQRVVPFGENFILASEGDCYPRAFTVSTTDIKNNYCNSYDIFDFWVEKNTLKNWNMFALNNNFAHLGGLAVGKDGTAALVATSAKSLSSAAKTENEQLFIQIFNPSQNLYTASGYITKGKRTGNAGPNGDEKVTNYGVKWLTNYSKKYEITNPQVVSTPEGNYVILFERYKNNSYQGVYCMTIDSAGKVLNQIARISKSAFLNPSEMPVYTKGKVYWVGNKTKSKAIHIYSYKVK